MGGGEGRGEEEEGGEEEGEEEGEKAEATMPERRSVNKMRMG